MSSISETSVWLKFFLNAGIPASDATGYAIIFCDNRIKQDMLMDLNKEYLKDMEITKMGDVIAILKHAKTVSEQLNRQKAFQPSQKNKFGKTLSSINKNSPLSDAPPKSTSAAARILEHYVRKEPPQPAQSSSEVNSKGLKRMSDEIEVSTTTKKNSVFNRLGDNSVSSTTSDNPKITVTMHGKDSMKSNVNKIMTDDYDSNECASSKESLQYQGILKYSSQELLNIKSKRVYTSSASSTDSLDSAPNIRSRLGNTTKRSSQSEGIFAKEAEGIFKSIVAKKKFASQAQVTSSSSRPIIRTISNPLEYTAELPPQKRSLENAAELPPEKKALEYTAELPPAKKLAKASENPPSHTRVIKKIVKINKRTGQIISEEKREIKSSVFSRLGL